MKSEQILFQQAVKSKHSFKTYKNALALFIKATKINLKKSTPKVIQDTLINYIIKLKEEKKSRSTQKTVISAVQKFCLANEIDGINFKRVRLFLSEQQKVNGGDRPYSREEIQRMLDSADTRGKALVLLLTSSGMRIGALPELNIEDLTDYQGVFKVRVYAGSNDEYTTFTTPEATQTLKLYIGKRQSGAVFVENYHGRRMTENSIYSIFKRLLARSKTRTKEVHLTHGFKKFVENKMIESGMDFVYVKLFCDHSLGVDEHYIRQEHKLFEQYSKAIPLLTIQESEHLRFENMRLVTENVETLKLKELIVKQQRQIDEQDKVMREVLEEMKKNNKKQEQAVGVSEQGLSEAKKTEQYILWLERKIGITPEQRKNLKID